jgi:hypothetical protein
MHAYNAWEIHIYDAWEMLTYEMAYGRDTPMRWPIEEVPL